jgi:hypothetical protein
MSDDALAEVYAYVERAYVRLQAADVLTHCLENGDAEPVQKLVEELVLVGTQSLSALREILAEVTSRKTQLRDDQNQIFSKLDDALKGYGASLLGSHTPLSVGHLTPVGFLALLRQQGVEDDNDQLICLQFFQDTIEFMGGIEKHLRLLDEIEIYLQDWLWGLIYQSTHEEWAEESSPPRQPKQWLL